MLLHIHAKPGRSVNELILTKDGTISVKINAQAKEGEANVELVKYLSCILNISRSSIRIIKGHTSSYKTINVIGNDAEITKKLQEYTE